jgi:hypothetical protein
MATTGTDLAPIDIDTLCTLFKFDAAVVCRALNSFLMVFKASRHLIAMGEVIAAKATGQAVTYDAENNLWIMLTFLRPNRLLVQV